MTEAITEPQISKTLQFLPAATLAFLKERVSTPIGDPAAKLAMTDNDVCTFAEAAMLNMSAFDGYGDSPVNLITRMLAPHGLGFGAEFYSATGEKLSAKQVLAAKPSDNIMVAVPEGQLIGPRLQACLDITFDGSEASRPLDDRGLAIMRESVQNTIFSEETKLRLGQLGYATVAEVATMPAGQLGTLSAGVTDDVRDCLEAYELGHGLTLRDRISGAILSREETLSLISRPELTLEQPAWTEVPLGITPALGKALLPLFKEAGYEAVIWPIPERVQANLARDLNAQNKFGHG